MAVSGGRLDGAVLLFLDAAAHEAPVGPLLLDVDNFEDVNDSFGQATTRHGLVPREAVPGGEVMHDATQDESYGRHVRNAEALRAAIAAGRPDDCGLRSGGRPGHRRCRASWTRPRSMGCRGHPRPPGLDYGTGSRHCPTSATCAPRS